MNILISFGLCSAPKLSKYVTLSPFTYNAIQCFLDDSCTHQDSKGMSHPLI